MAGKTIRIYLADGVPNGILTAEIINWTGKVIVGARTQLTALAKRDEVRRTGVYCLVGPDPERLHQDRVYVGEADNVMARLAAHEKDESKDFWTRAAIVISKDENLTKSHGRYLESRLIGVAHAAGRAVVTNGTAPPAPPLPESDVADMEYFLDQVQMVFPVLGLSFLQPKPDQGSAPGGTGLSGTVFVVNEGKRQARAAIINDEFVVLKGSPARKRGVASWDSYRGQRDDLVAAQQPFDSDDPDYYVFADNVPFASPSAAAAVVAAANRNGRMNWRVEATGQTYAQWQEEKLAQAGTPAST